MAINAESVNRQWLLSRLTDIAAMGPHMPMALDEFIDELGGHEADDPIEVVFTPRRSLWLRAVNWQPRR